MRRFLKYAAVFLVLEMILGLAAFVPALAAGVLSVSPASGQPGVPVTVSGTGFADNDRITISFDAVVVGSTAASGTGTWSPSIVIPTAVAGPHTILASGPLSGTST